jgi:hypothetical protein
MALSLTTPVLAGGPERSLLPADTDWVVHVDFKTFMKTELSRLILQNQKMKEMKTAEEQLKEHLGLDIYEDIDTITAFGTGDREKKKFMVSFIGDFDEKHLFKKVTQQMKKHESKKKIDTFKYSGHTIYDLPDAGYAVFLGKNQVVFGCCHMDDIKDLVDNRKNRKSQIAGKSLNKYLDMIPDNAFISGAVNDISSMAKMGKGGYPGAILKATGLASFIAMENNKILNMHVSLDTDSEESSKNIVNIANGLISLGRIKLKEESPEMMEIADSLKITNRGNTVHLDISFPTEQLMQFIEKRKHMGMRHKH